jgi:hypothetical protein
MKKLALALILLVALIGISYVNSTRSEAKLKKQFTEGFESGSKDTKTAIQRADSVAQEMELTKGRYRDSLVSLTTLSQVESDSLEMVIDQKDHEIAGLKEKAKAARSQKTTAKSASVQSSLKHSQVLDYYKRRLNELPKDLSEYERKIALSEVRDETAKKFSITVGELDKLRQSSAMKD